MYVNDHDVDDGDHDVDDVDDGDAPLASLCEVLVFSDHSVKILPAGDGRETMECLPSSPS